MTYLKLTKLMEFEGREKERDRDGQPLLENGNEQSKRPSLDYYKTTQEDMLRKIKNKKPLEWLFYCLSVLYVPLVVLYVSLYLKVSAPSQCENDQLDIFPCA